MGMLAERVVGTWILVRCVTRYADGRETYPVGPDQQGILVYSPDGFVSVNLSAARRRPLGASSFAEASDAQLAGVARGYMAYAGPYRVDEDAGTIHHGFQLCLNPDMIDTPQVRIARFVGDNLELSVPETIVRGEACSVHLEWRRPGAAA